MPPRRRSGTAATARQSNQPTLRFGNQSRVSKPTSTSTAAAVGKSLKDRSASPAKDISTASPVAEVQIDEATGASASASTSTPTQRPADASLYSENLVREQARVEAQQPRSEEDERALGLTDRELKRYWRAEEESRIAPRVHQEDLSVNDKILRHFDLSSQYGPCIGIARLKRWRRANMLNLNPPLEVLAVLLQGEARGEPKEKAYVDELLS